MSSPREDVRNYLSMIVQLRKSHVPADWVYVCPEDVVLQCGREFSERCTAVKPKPIKRCFNNAFELLLEDPSLTYCEGFALPPGLIPMHHAWCCDADGVVHDPTWIEDRHGLAYYLGCAFDTEYVCELALRTGVPGVFSDGNEMLRHELVRGEFKLWSPTSSPPTFSPSSSSPSC